MAASSYTYNAAQLKLLGTACQILLVLFMGMTALITAFSGFLAFQEMSEGFSMHLFTLPVYAGLIVLAFVPTAAVLTLWVWRAHANLHASALADLKYSPSWAAISLWLPVINLVVPFGIMRQLWNRSHGEEPWFANQSVEAASSWWACYVIGVVVVTLLSFLALLDRFTNLAILTPPGTNSLGFAFGALLLCGSAWFLLRLVTRITAAQQGAVIVGNTFD